MSETKESEQICIKDKRFKKIVILAFTACGHLNTILKTTKELVDISDVQVIIYGLDQHRGLIEKSGAKFKCYKNLKMDSFKPPPLNNRKRLGYALSIDQLFKITSDILSTLEHEIEMEDPDLLLYDHFSVFGAWVVRSMRQKYQQFMESNTNLRAVTRKSPKPPPLSIMYHTSFAFSEPVYPNLVEKNVMDSGHSIYNRIRLFYYKIKICNYL
jgi:hypothetical protein